MQLAPDLAQQIVDHALRDAPNECCGIVSVRDGVAEKVYELTNVQASPLRFEVDPKELLAAMTEIEDAGAEFKGLYHSHTRSEPRPSPTDINFAGKIAGFYGDVEWLIVGTAGDEPVLANWHIRDGVVTEAPLT